MRYDHLTRISIEDDIEIYDLLSADIRGFTITGQYQLYSLTETDVIKPYVISQNFYGTVDYTDLLFMFNGIENLLSDLFTGMVIMVPDEKSIQDYMIQTKTF